jgi:hypothetical protein
MQIPPSSYTYKCIMSLYQWMIYCTNIMLDIVHCLQYNLFDLHDVSEISLAPVFMWLVVVISTRHSTNYHHVKAYTMSVDFKNHLRDKVKKRKELSL